MKSIRILIVALTLAGSGHAFAQSSNTQITTTPPSDAPAGYTYDWDITRQLILDRIAKPSDANKDAQPLLDAADFPAYKGKAIDDAFKAKLKEWMEKNSTLIINTLKHRKDIVTPF